MGKLKVYYGIEKTNNVKHKRAVCVLFENSVPFRVDNKGNSYQDRFINRQMYLAYTRKQTLDEEKDALMQNRVFTGFSMFIDDKPFNGSIEKVLEFNDKADINNVSRAERERIKDALRKKFKEIYPDYKEPTGMNDLFAGL